MYFSGEGYKVLYQVALTIIKLNEQAIWDAQDSIDTIQILQNMPRRLINCHEFIKVIIIIKMYSIFLTKQKQHSPSFHLMVLPLMSQRKKLTVKGIYFETVKLKDKTKIYYKTIDFFFPFIKIYIQNCNIYSPIFFYILNVSTYNLLV